MSLGYFDDLTDAKLYFTDERLETSAWDDLENIYRTKLVNQAYNRIFYCPEFDLPTVANATAAELVILKKANGEMAYYLALHSADEDRRKGLQAQGVTGAGIVKESYDKDALDNMPIPQIVKNLLSDFKAFLPFHAIDIDRDEDESVEENVTEY